MASSASVTVPATTANIGPGFDCLGAALTLYNHFEFQVLGTGAPTVLIRAQGIESSAVPQGDDNLVYTSFVRLFEMLQQDPPPIEISIQLNVPLSRGLGSSATAIIGGLVGANAIADFPCSTEELLELAIAIEGHPDNVAPALLGNCQLAVRQTPSKTLLCPIPWAENLMPVVAIPDFELSTHAARTVLPDSCDYDTAIFNSSHLGLLIKALESGHPDWLTVALDDRLHQPFRQSLIHGYRQVRDAALDSGAYGLVISGAGPSLLALCPSSMADAIASAMKKAWRSQGVEASLLQLRIDQAGTQVAIKQQESLST